MGESGPVQDLHDLVGDLSLRLWKRGRRAPVQASANILVKPRLRTRELIGAPVQLSDLLEQGLEELVVDRHEPNATCSANEPTPRATAGSLRASVGL